MFCLPVRVLNFMLMCSWLSFNFKSKEKYNSKALDLGRKRPGKMNPYRFFFFFLQKGPKWESESSGSLPQKNAPPHTPLGS